VAPAFESLVGNKGLVEPVEELSGPVKVKEVKAGLQSTSDDPVPLRSTRAKAAVIDLIAEVTLFQEYENTGDASIEAKYVFPLQRGSAVCGFEAFINAKHVVGRVKEKEEARREYKAAGHGAYLMDESEEAPDVFTVSVGNLPPKTRVVVKIVYVMELQVDAARNAIEFVIPSSVHPAVRDAELRTATQATTGTVASRGAAGNVSIEVGLDMPYDIVAVECSHAVSRKRTACRATLRATGVSFASGDFVVLTRLAVMHTPRIWVEENHAQGTRAAMITFFPEIGASLGKHEARGTGERELVLLLDASGSMAQGNALADAKTAALMAVDMVPAAWALNVCLFRQRAAVLLPAVARGGRGGEGGGEGVHPGGVRAGDGRHELRGGAAAAGHPDGRLQGGVRGGQRERRAAVPGAVGGGGGGERRVGGGRRAAGGGAAGGKVILVASA